MANTVKEYSQMIGWLTRDKTTDVPGSMAHGLRTGLYDGGRVGFDYGGIVNAFNELINEGKTTFASRKELMDAIQAKTGKRPGGSFQASNNNYADLFKKITFTSPNIRTKQGDPEDYKINETQKKDLTKKVNKLNKKYKLDKKGIKVALGKTQSGNTTLQFQTNTNVYGDYFKDTLGISTKKSVTPNISGLNELEGYLKTITKSDLFKNYDKSAAMQKGGIESSKKQLENIGSKKPEVFNYLLNNENATIEQIAKDLDLKQGVVTKNLQGLYTDIYKRYGDQGAVYLKEFDANQLNSVHNTIKNTNVKLKDRVKNLVIDAYKGDKNLKPLLEKIDNFYEIQAKVKKTPYGKFFAGNLDHVIPLNFLRELDEGANPMELIRIKPLPEFLNQRAFKAQFDKVLGTAYRNRLKPGGKEALEAIVNLQSYLPKEFGGITSEGKIIDYGAKPFTLKTNLSTTEFPEIYKRVFSFINNPDLQDTFDEAGVSFKSLKSKEKEIMKQAGGYNKLIEDLQNVISKGGAKGKAAGRALQILAAGVGGYKMEDILKGTGLMDKEYELTASAGDAPIVEKGLSTGEKAAAGTGAALGIGTKLGRKALGTGIQLATGPIGIAGLTYALRPEGGYDLRRTGDRIGFELEAALAPTLVKGVTDISSKIKNPLFRKGLETLTGVRIPGIMTPTNLLRAARVASPIGIASLAGEGLYELGKRGYEQRKLMETMTEEEKRDFLADQYEDLGGVFGEGA